VETWLLDNRFDRNPKFSREFVAQTHRLCVQPRLDFCRVGVSRFEEMKIHF
jgi:hypothetical protein